MNRVGSLEIDENMRFQRVEWAVEIVGYVALFLFLALALWGPLGNDPKCLRAAATDDGALRVRYERFAHWQTRSSFEIDALPKSPNLTAAVSIDNGYLRNVTVTGITPAPERTISDATRTTFVFRGTDAARPVSARIHVEPDEPGRLAAEISLEGSGTLDLPQFVLP